VWNNVISDVVDIEVGINREGVRGPCLLLIRHRSELHEESVEGVLDVANLGLAVQRHLAGGLAETQARTTLGVVISQTLAAGVAARTLPGSAVDLALAGRGQLALRYHRSALLVVAVLGGCYRTNQDQ